MEKERDEAKHEAKVARLVTSVVGDARARVEEALCHAPIPCPTRLADPNRVRGARLSTMTLYLFFFSDIGGPMSYNKIKISYTKLKELPPEWCPSKSIRIY